jgi:hypothetical protein
MPQQQHVLKGDVVGGDPDLLGELRVFSVAAPFHHDNGIIGGFS